MTHQISDSPATCCKYKIFRKPNQIIARHVPENGFDPSNTVFGSFEMNVAFEHLVRPMLKIY
jgi:hypothetical protein